MENEQSYNKLRQKLPPILQFA